jgi:hypothetical protein
MYWNVASQIQIIKVPACIPHRFTRHLQWQSGSLPNTTALYNQGSLNFLRMFMEQGEIF